MKEPVSPAFAVKDGGSSAGQHEKILAMVQIALFTAIIAVCSWIQIILGGKSGTISVLLYIVLGTIGVPVFAGFSGGIGTLLGMTGGYIIGFLFSALIYWGITRWLGEKLPVMILAMVLGLAACYAFGTAWFMVVYTRQIGEIGLMASLTSCVFPFILPDCVKIALAILLAKRLPKRLIRRV